jgi:hypothetical protein
MKGKFHKHTQKLAKIVENMGVWVDIGNFDIGDWLEWTHNTNGMHEGHW